MANPSMAAPRLLVAALVAALVLCSADRAHVAEAVTCRASELNSCVPAMTSHLQPSAFCCSKMREQRRCLCAYIRNPSLWDYLTSVNGIRVMRVCGVPYPKCN